MIYVQHDLSNPYPFNIVPKVYYGIISLHPSLLTTLENVPAPDLQFCINYIPSVRKIRATFLSFHRGGVELRYI